MNKSAVLVFVFVFILIAIVSLTISSKSNYIKIPEYTDSKTKAICNSENLCQDYQIFCNNNQVVSMSPITGAVVQFQKDWKDPRSPELLSQDC